MGEKPKISRIARNLELKWMGNQVSRQIDIKKKDSKDALFESWIMLVDCVDEIKKTNRRNPSCDFSFEVTMFADGDQTLLMYNCEHESMTGILDSNPLIKDYCYWDDTDPDEDVSPEDWELREKTWDRFIRAGMAPSDKGVFMTMYNHEKIAIPKAEEILKYIPSRQERALEICRTRYFAEYEKSVRDQKPEITGSEMTSLLISEVMKFRKNTIPQEEIETQIQSLVEIDINFLKGNQNESSNSKPV
jgi:hypothetical protein